MKKLGLVPLRNFAVVEEDKIYRSAQPIYQYEYRWLEEVLGINTIINLRNESHHDDTMQDLGRHKMHVMNIGVRDHGVPTLEQCEYFMNVIRKLTGKVLFHCEHGHGRTSTFCVLARLAQGWDLNAALREEEEEYHYNFKHAAQKAFLLENFGKEIEK